MFLKICSLGKGVWTESDNLDSVPDVHIMKGGK